MAKKNSMGLAGGVLLFVGSLIYLYVFFFAWYAAGLSNAAALAAPWLSAASFLAPFVIAFAVISAIALFFMGIGMMAGKMSGDKEKMAVWKFLILGGMTMLILTGVGQYFYAVVVGFVLTYLGATIAEM